MPKPLERRVRWTSRAIALCALALLAGAPTGPRAGMGVIPEARRTRWQPGIPGGVPTDGEIHATLDPAAVGDGHVDAAPAINRAIQAAGDAAQRRRRRQIVRLPAGVYRLGAPVLLNRSHVVLRGDGPDRTFLRHDAPVEQAAIRVGWKWEYTGVWDVTADARKGATRIQVSDARAIEPGDVLQIDQQDGPYVWPNGGRYFKRQAQADIHGPGTGGGPMRSVGQQVEVASKRGGVLELTTPLHLDFPAARKPQVFKTATARAGEPGTRDVGIEDLYVTGGNQGNIVMVNVAYSWVKNVESNGDPGSGPAGAFGTPSGMEGIHLRMLHAFRCEVRDSYFHHARRIIPGGVAYGIDPGTQSSENLIENNVVVHLNKPVVLNGSGGGNVIAYNYVDEAYSSTHDSWHENAIDGCHSTFSHSDLFEGNWAANIGSDTTHGNSGWHTFFRNHVPGMNSTVRRGGHVRAVGIDGYSREHSIVGNVLLQPGLEVGGAKPVYECVREGACMRAPAVYRIGANTRNYDDFDDGTALAHLYRHGNFDYVTHSVVWDAAVADRALPPSLYLTERPPFFGDRTWPWVDPTGRVKVHVLPAKERYDRMAKSSRGATPKG